MPQKTNQFGKDFKYAKATENDHDEEIIKRRIFSFVGNIQKRVIELWAMSYERESEKLLRVLISICRNVYRFEIICDLIWSGMYMTSIFQEKICEKNNRNN